MDWTSFELDLGKAYLRGRPTAFEMDNQQNHELAGMSATLCGKATKSVDAGELLWQSRGLGHDEAGQELAPESIGGEPLAAIS